MARRLSTRIQEIERRTVAADASRKLFPVLVELLGRRDAIYWPWRWNETRNLAAIHQRQREYLQGEVGLAVKAQGEADWKAAYNARQSLVASGLCYGVYAGGQITSVILTATGEATARRVVGGLLDCQRVAFIFSRLIELGGRSQWVSESMLFDEELSGDPNDWQCYTELVLPLLTAGAVISQPDTQGRVAYRVQHDELPESPTVNVQQNPDADAEWYHPAFKAERNHLANREPSDPHAITIPLAPIR